MFHVYVLQSLKDGVRYVGQTSLESAERLAEHNQNKSSFTRGHQPWMLVLSEDFNTRAEAVKREKFLKSGQGRKWLDEILSM